MKKVAWCLWLVLAIMGFHSAKAEEVITGNSLYRACNEKISLEICHSWILGFMQGLQWGANGGGLVCVPDNVTYAQGGLVIQKYLRDHPEHLHLPASGIAYGALSQAFPCPKSK